MLLHSGIKEKDKKTKHETTMTSAERQTLLASHFD